MRIYILTARIKDAYRRNKRHDAEGRTEGVHEIAKNFLPLPFPPLRSDKIPIFETMIQIINKPIEEMTLTELKQERSVHQWQATKSQRGSEALRKRLFWLEENEPIYSREEIHQAHEAGRLTDEQYKTAFARRAKAINYRRRAENQAEYSRRVEAEERAFILEIDERILQLEATQPKPKRGRPYKRDPRRREAPLRKVYKRPQELKTLRKRWTILQQAGRINKGVPPLQNWNIETLKKIAYDRGFFTERSFIYHISQELQLSYTATRTLLKTGAFTFGQALIVGAYLEMTPKEFCDTFLYNYFRDPGFGSFYATVDNKNNLLYAPVKTPKRGTDNVNA